MTTITHFPAGGNAQKTARIATLIPRGTAQDRLHRLSDRYAHDADPVVAAIPTFYRQAIRGRLHELLATAREPATIAGPSGHQDHTKQVRLTAKSARRASKRPVTPERIATCPGGHDLAILSLMKSTPPPRIAEITRRDDGSIAFRVPYEPRWVQHVKMAIPARARKWDAERTLDRLAAFCGVVARLQPADVRRVARVGESATCRRTVRELWRAPSCLGTRRTRARMPDVGDEREAIAIVGHMRPELQHTSTRRRPSGHTPTAKE